MKASRRVRRRGRRCSPRIAAVGQRSRRASKRAEPVNEMVSTEEKGRKLGESVSAQIRARFGVVQDEAVHGSVTLVGTVVALQTGKPNLPWTFIVLDTDGVNAFASPSRSSTSRAARSRSCRAKRSSQACSGMRSATS